MASTTTGPSGSTRSGPAYQDDSGSGWVAFAGIMIGLIGIMNIIYGIAAISESRFYVQDATYILSGLNTYGWIALIVGIVQLGTAFAIFAGKNWARWLGIAAAAFNALLQIVFVASYPLASLALLALDVLVIYGLVAYGGRARAAL